MLHHHCLFSHFIISLNYCAHNPIVRICFVADLIPLDLSHFSFYHLLKPKEAISVHADNDIVRVPPGNQANNLSSELLPKHFRR